MSNKWTEEQIFEDDKQAREYGACYHFKKSNVKINGKKSVGFIFAMLVLSALCIYFTSSTIVRAVNASAQSGNEQMLQFSLSNYFLVSLANYISPEIATDISKDVRLKGGAGYIYAKNNEFYIIAAAYNTEQEAKSVQSKLGSGYNAQIIEVSAPSISFNFALNTEQGDNDYNKDEVDVVKINEENLLDIKSVENVHQSAFDFLSNLSVSYDLKKSTMHECKLKALNYFSAFKSLHNKYLSFAENIKELKSLTNSLNTLCSALEMASEVSLSEEDYSQTLKYSAILVVKSRIELNQNA